MTSVKSTAEQQPQWQGEYVAMCQREDARAEREEATPLVARHHALMRVGRVPEAELAKRSEWDDILEDAPPVGTRSGTTLLEECGQIMSSARAAGRSHSSSSGSVEALRGSNTQCNTQCASSQAMTIESLGSLLLPSSSYLPPVHEPDHWSKTDPLLFQSLPQGGGGIDWLVIAVYGQLTSGGKSLRDKLVEVKQLCTKKNPHELARGMGVSVIGSQYRQRITIEHPNHEARLLSLNYANSGTGRSFNPLMAHIDGVCVRWGRISDSTSEAGENKGPIAFVEIPGMMFLRHGEARAIAIAERVLLSLGVMVMSVRPIRVDACADLPGQDVAEFVEAVHVGKYVSKCVGRINYYADAKSRRPTGFSLKSSACSLTVYEKRIELRDKPHEEKLALMEQNRWGGPQEMATRVEFKFNVGKHRSRSYSSLKELCEGLGDLLGWALNVWFRLADVDDRTHTTRAQIVDCWLRALHAFAFWSHRLGQRPQPKTVKALPSDRLIRNAAGVFATAIARTGSVPEDDFTIFGVLATWMAPGEMARKCRERALEFQAMQGTNGERGSPEVLGGEDLPYAAMAKRLREAARIAALSRRDSTDHFVVVVQGRESDVSEDR